MIMHFEIQIEIGYLDATTEGNSAIFYFCT